MLSSSSGTFTQSIMYKINLSISTIGDINMAFVILLSAKEISEKYAPILFTIRIVLLYWGIIESK